MKTVLVGIPILKDARRFHYLKGRRWTVFEHVVLEAVARKEWAIAELAEESDLPRRVVIEVLIRLMRAGWVQLKLLQNAVHFEATPVGRAHATRSELPPITRPESRYIAFTVELVSQSVFKARDLVPVTEDQWARRIQGRTSVRLTPPSLTGGASLNPEARVLAETLLDPDEELTHVDLHDWKPAKRLAVLSVRGDTIEGFGSPPSEKLRLAVLEAAARAPSYGTVVSVIEAPRVTQALVQRPVRPFQFRLEDLILGGATHKSVLEQQLARARHRVVLHSTFIDVGRAKPIVECLKSTVMRGAHVDVLWGQSDDPKERAGSWRAAAELRSHVEQQGLADRLRLHLTSTGSHAKILLSDNGDPSKFQAVIGSCNWLSTGFESFDASYRLRDPGIVADVAYELAEMAFTRDGQFTEMSTELIRLGRILERRQQEARTGAGSARILRGAEHAQAILDARDSAVKTIMVMSHRLGANARPTLIPLAASAKANGVKPHVFYNKVTGVVTAARAADEIFDIREDGVELKAVIRPRLHAKVLAWDDDDAVITSQNWLSADPPSGSRRELGIRLHAPGCARSIAEQFRIAREFQ